MYAPFILRTLRFRATIGLALLSLPTTMSQAQTVYGLASQVGLDSRTPPATTDVSLVTFNLASLTPTSSTTVDSHKTISGLTSGQYLVGLDARPNTGELFVLGYNPATQQTQLYTLNKMTAIATVVGVAQALNLGTDIGRIGFDFNPTVDRIRITASNGTNLRLNPNDGTLTATDESLAYAAMDVNAGQSASIGSSAYTNSYPGATVTTLYNLDEENNRLVTQTPPNTGTLNTVGPTNIDFSSLHTPVDLDIYYNAATSTNTAYLSVADPDYANFETKIFMLDVAGGATTLAGKVITATKEVVTDIAFASNQGVTTATQAPAVAKGLGLALYPNPVIAGESTITFTLPRAGQLHLTVTNAVGCTVTRVDAGLLGSGRQTLHWQVTDYKAGTYLVQLSLDGKSIGSQRLVVW